MNRNKQGQFKKGGQNRKYYPKLGATFGDFTVISDDAIISKDQKVKYKVECSCGHQQFIRAYFIESGRQTSCKSCSSKRAFNKALLEGKMVGFIKPKHEGVGDFTKTVYSYFKNNGKRRSIPWSKELTIEFLYELLLKQDRKCALTGVNIELTEKRKDSNINFSKMTASLDRIDSDIGYTPTNIQWVHKDINRLKWAFKQDYFIELCKRVANNNNN